MQGEREGERYRERERERGREILRERESDREKHDPKATSRGAEPHRSQTHPRNLPSALLSALSLTSL